MGRRPGSVKLEDRPGLQVDDGVLHRLLVVFAHVLVHVWVVGADVFLRAAVGHRAKLQRRVLLLGMLELVKHRKVMEVRRGRVREVREVRAADRRGPRDAPASTAICLT